MFGSEWGSVSHSVHVLSPASVKWNQVFDKTSQNFECVSRARCLLKATPALYDNEMEDSVSLRIRRLFGVRFVWEFLGICSCGGLVGYESKVQKCRASLKACARWNFTKNTIIVQLWFFYFWLSSTWCGSYSTSHFLQASLWPCVEIVSWMLRYIFCISVYVFEVHHIALSSAYRLWGLL